MSEWFTENRKEMWSDKDVTLMQLAMEAKAYEGSDTHREKSRQLPAAYKKDGTMAMVNAMGADHKNGSSWPCYLCGEHGHLFAKCPMLPALRKLAKREADSGGCGNTPTGVATVKFRDEMNGPRRDVAHLATSTGVDYVGMTDKTQREMGY